MDRIVLGVWRCLKEDGFDTVCDLVKVIYGLWAGECNSNVTLYLSIKKRPTFTSRLCKLQRDTVDVIIL